jgi:TRAP-type mannitol/chloroaromatic compound transport system substrate-binding protein
VPIGFRRIRSYSAPVADAYPYRNVSTGKIQLATEAQISIFPGQFEKLPDDYEELQAHAAEAAALVDAAKDSDASKAAVKRAEDEAKKAAEAVENAPTVVGESTTDPKES